MKYSLFCYCECSLLIGWLIDVCFECYRLIGWFCEDFITGPSLGKFHLLPVLLLYCCTQKLLTGLLNTHPPLKPTPPPPITGIPILSSHIFLMSPVLEFDTHFPNHAISQHLRKKNHWYISHKFFIVWFSTQVCVLKLLKIRKNDIKYSIG